MGSLSAFEKRNHKGNEEKKISTLLKMDDEIESICNMLVKASDRFNDESINEVICKVEEYIKKHDRIMYSTISNYIYSLSDEMRETFSINLERLVEKALDFDDEIYKRNRNILLKIRDHVHLALCQFGALKDDDSEFSRKFNNSIIPVKADVEKQLGEFTKTMNSQLISLVGIFTAMSFLVFGGINALDNIFQGVRSIPILQVMIVGTIWGICITNLVFIFMFFISKMTGLPIKSNLSKEAKLVEKYPLILWSNLILIIILATCSWLYFIDIQDIGWDIIKWIKQCPSIISILGIVFIGIVFLTCFCLLIGKTNTKDYIEKIFSFRLIKWREKGKITSKNAEM